VNHPHDNERPCTCVDRTMENGIALDMLLRGMTASAVAGESVGAGVTFERKPIPVWTTKDGRQVHVTAALPDEAHVRGMLVLRDGDRLVVTGDGGAFVTFSVAAALFVSFAYVDAPEATS
jgi:hypothetical protein